MLAAALAASRYGAVIPLSAQRTPLTAFDDGRRDPEGIKALWHRYPSAGVGVLAWTGSLLVIDVEHPDKKPGGPDGFATMRTLCKQLGPLKRTRTHTTKSGGRHYVYAVPEGCKVRSSQGTLRGAELGAPGVDVVTGRAVLRWPPTGGYALEGDLMGCVPLPASWLDAMTERERPPAPPKQFTDHERIAHYVSRAIQLEADELAGVQATRNCALAKSAYKLGSLADHVSEETIEEALLGACEANGSLREHGRRMCTNTIRRCIASGAKHPRNLELVR